MEANEFVNLASEAALEYANECVMDPEEHQDAVDAIATDFEEGAAWAYSVLEGEE